MTIVGTGDLKFELDPDWPRGMPEGWEFTLASGVAVNSRDEVYVFSRGVHPITMWNTDGDFITSWGEASCLDPADRYNGTFRDPHGIYVGPDDSSGLRTRRRTPSRSTRDWVKSLWSLADVTTQTSPCLRRVTTVCRSTCLPVWLSTMRATFWCPTDTPIGTFTPSRPMASY